MESQQALLGQKNLVNTGFFVVYGGVDNFVDVYVYGYIIYILQVYVTNHDKIKKDVVLGY